MDRLFGVTVRMCQDVSAGNEIPDVRVCRAENSAKWDDRTINFTPYKSKLQEYEAV